MDIEKLQRITRLSRDLLAQGMADDIEEATRMADSMIDKNRELGQIQDTISGVNMQRSAPPPMQPSSIEQPIYHNEQPAQPFQQQPEKVAQQPVVSEVRDNELRNQVSNLVMQLGEQTKEIDALRKGMNQIITEINRIEKERKEHPAVMEKTPHQSQTSLHTEEIKKAEPHPKVGGFDSSDVTVENIFYSGPPK